MSAVFVVVATDIILKVLKESTTRDLRKVFDFHVLISSSFTRVFDVRGSVRPSSAIQLVK